MSGSWTHNDLFGNWHDWHGNELLSCLCETTPAKAVQVVVSATFAFTYLCTVKHCETLFLSATYFCGLYSGGLVFVHLEMQAPTMSIRLSDPDLWTDKVPSNDCNVCNEIVHRTSLYIIVHRKSTIENNEWDVCYFRRLQQELVACKVHELANRGVTLTSLLNFWRKLEQVVCNLFLDVFSARRSSACWHMLACWQLSSAFCFVNLFALFVEHVDRNFRRWCRASIHKSQQPTTWCDWQLAVKRCRTWNRTGWYR